MLICVESDVEILDPEKVMLPADATPVRPDPSPVKDVATTVPLTSNPSSIVTTVESFDLIIFCTIRSDSTTTCPVPFGVSVIEPFVTSVEIWLTFIDTLAESVPKVAL